MRHRFPHLLRVEEPGTRFRLDAEARAAKKPSDDFRKDHPWRDGEGPDAAGPRPSGER